MGKSVMDGLQCPVQVAGVQVEPEPESIFSIYQLKDVVQGIAGSDLVVIAELAHRVIFVLPADETGQGLPFLGTIVHHHAHCFIDGFAHTFCPFKVKWVVCAAGIRSMRQRTWAHGSTWRRSRSLCPRTTTTSHPANGYR